MKIRYLLLFLIINYSFQFKKNKRFPKNSVQKKKLVRVNVGINGILENHNFTHSDTKFNPVKVKKLGFLTPWNTNGYEYSLKYNYKFDMISPVWFQIINDNGILKINGKHHLNDKNIKIWLSKMKQTKTKIVPRFSLDFKTLNDFELLFSNNNNDQIINSIVKLINENGFNGLVFEYGFLHFKKFSNGLINVISKLKRKLNFKNNSKKKKKELLLVVPPSRSSQEFFSYNDFESIKNYIDFLIVMTYDFESYPLAPLEWMKRSILNISPTNNKYRSKILMGIQFYGYKIIDGKKEAIIFRDYLNLIQTYKPKINWDKNNKEHYFQFTNDQNKQVHVRFPTLKFLEERLELSKKIGTGVSVWELGQGLEYFFDLF